MNQPSLSANPSAQQTNLFREFESAWKVVLEGPPQIEAYIARLSASEQASARETLEQIAARFRAQLDSRRLSGSPQQTVDPAPSEVPEVPAPLPASSTVDESQGVVVNTGTVDESKGVVIGTGTVDESQGQRLGDGAMKKGTSKRPVIPGYLITGELGRGGMGVVYKARHLALDRDVALKMILGGAQVDDMQLERFYTEAKAVAQMQHPGIVQVFEISEHDGMPFFSLEYVDGGSLAKKIKREPQPPAEAAAMIEKIALAVQLAHDKKIIHRDLKPANVLLTDKGEPKVTDFGLARRLEGDAGQTRSGSVLGTPSYMAPEQARGDVENVGPLADVYALGAMLYEMLTGKPPFQAATILETLEQVEKQEPVPPVQLAPRTPKDLDTICLKCLQKDPAKRYQSAGEMAADLRRFQEGRPITARPVSRAEKFWRMCRRNPVVSSLSGLASLLVVAGIVGLAIGLWIVNHQKNETKAALVETQKAKDGETAAKETAIAAQQAEAKISHDSVIAAQGVLRRAQRAFRLRPDLDQIRLDVTTYTVQSFEKLSAHLRSPTHKDRTDAMGNATLGEIYFDAGDIQKSKTHYELAHATLERYAKEHLDSPIAKRNLAAAKNRLGEIALIYGDGAKARSFAADALELRKQWRTAFEEELAGKRKPPEIDTREPATQDHVYVARISVAQSYALLGNISLKQGDPRVALDFYRQSKQEFDAVPEKYYANVMPLIVRRDYEIERTGLEQRLGLTSLQAGQTAQARKHLQEAFRQRLERRKKDDGADTSRELAMSRLDMGNLEDLHENNPVVAAGWYRLAVVGYENLLKSFPNVFTCIRDLGGADYLMGSACQRAAARCKGIEAAAWLATSQFHFDRSRQAYERLAKVDPKNTGVVGTLMLAEARCGKRSEALNRAAALLKQSPNDPRVLFKCACGYALVGEQDKALATIEKAVACGYKDTEALRLDPDLEAVLGHPRVVALRQKLLDATK